jgi:hypothetical protein
MTEIDVRPEELTALAALFAPAHVADPYPAYARWRARRPAPWWLAAPTAKARATAVTISISIVTLSS